MAGGVDHKRRAHRSYKPAVEAMEVLRLLSGAAATATFPAVAAEHHMLVDSGLAAPTLDSPAVTDHAWDAALHDAGLDGLLSARASSYTAEPSIVPRADAESTASGLLQLNKYLNRSWYRAAIPLQAHEDCSQAVYATLLQQLGRPRFDALLSDVGRGGVKEVFSRETTEGLDFFRAVDMVKKRAQRERVFQSIDSVDVAGSSSDLETRSWRDSLQEAIDRSLTAREASLIYETLKGKTPAEIALHWGVAPKTVSNEKTRVIQKLRDVLQTQAAD
ncbi:MAG: LuxR C-terminal-related transcriptional regulator [Paludisphaera borealis]|uniref:LuxR C-terminal-related transcriptional regulator n=1 Tax=Paludisphaera borealis TaxID=1387353 RepID=UPI00284D6B42|nr:LuxR C-terminal-related transcriptional regulator [Paludisphaera borealis]MDR3618640.1 LuxR C-terminal-related transcriptional regulator [Paludisphaera borealis]